MKCIICNSKIVGPVPSPKSNYTNNRCCCCGFIYQIYIRHDYVEYCIVAPGNFNQVCFFTVDHAGELLSWRLEASYAGLKLHQQWVAIVTEFKLSK